MVSTQQMVAGKKKKKIRRRRKKEIELVTMSRQDGSREH